MSRRYEGLVRFVGGSIFLTSVCLALPLILLSEVAAALNGVTIDILV